MEKLRVYIEVVKKYHFWILFGLILVISLAFWSVASADLNSRFDKRKKVLIGVEGNLNSILSNPKVPKEETIKEIQHLIGKDAANQKNTLTSQVLDAWRTLYRAQRRENELPDIYNSKLPKANELDKRLQEAFTNRFYKIWRPMEEIEQLPKLEWFTDQERDQYLNHIQQYFPKLFDLVERRHIEVIPEAERTDLRSLRGPAAAHTETTRTVGVVDWPDSDYVMRRFSTWTGRPSPIQIMLAQEEIWVYEAMLKVIRNTNNMADTFDGKYVSPKSHKMARVKQIQVMDVGEQAFADWATADQSVFKLPADSNAPQTVAPNSAWLGQASYIQNPNGLSGQSVLANHYVDDKGKQVEDPLKQPYAEFRMMPIYLKVVIEQSAIPRFLAACANSSMRIDVKAFRLLANELPPFEAESTDASAISNPSAPTGTPAAGTQPGAAPGRPTRGRPGYTPRGPRPGAPRANNNNDPSSPSFAPAPIEEDDAIDQTRPTVVVAIHGVVYIYNKPAYAKLGTGIATGGSGAVLPVPGSPEAKNTDLDDDSDAPVSSAPGANGGSPTAAPAADATKPPATSPAATPTNSGPTNGGPTNGVPNTPKTAADSVNPAGGASQVNPGNASAKPAPPASSQTPTTAPAAKGAQP